MKPAASAPPGYRTMATTPDDFVHRRELDEVRELLCAAAADGGAVGITTALRCAGGFGKTTLAQALAFDERVLLFFTLYRPASPGECPRAIALISRHQGSVTFECQVAVSTSSD